MMPIQLPLIHIDRKNKTCLLKNKQGKSFPATMQEWLCDSIMLGDDAVVTKSQVSGEWIVIDYEVDTMTNQELDDFYNSLTEEDVMGTVDEEPQYQLVLEDFQ